MPLTKSAHKALRQSKKRRVANKTKMTELKSVIKDFKKMVAAGKVKEAKKQLDIAFKKLDKAAKINIIKKNKSSRLKSRLSLSLNKHSK